MMVVYNMIRYIRQRPTRAGGICVVMIQLRHRRFFFSQLQLNYCTSRCKEIVLVQNFWSILFLEYVKL